MTTRNSRLAAWLALFSVIAPLLIVVGCGASGAAPDFPTEVENTPAEDSIGERLFLDTRFAEYFAANMTGVN